MTIFVNKGDAYLTPEQLERRAQKYITRSWPAQEREKSIRSNDGKFNAFMETFSANHAVNKENNTFNWQLQEYKKSVERLSQYILSEGKPSEAIEYSTGTFDEEGNEIMSITVVPAIAALDAQVEENIFDEEGNLTGTQMVDNPLIVADDAERAEAQAVINATPAEVVAWD